jgi:ATP-dependent DNA helicase RecG
LSGSNPSYRPKAYRFILDEIEKGRQAYVICPMIEESGCGYRKCRKLRTDFKKEMPSKVKIEILHET